jgi:hypothetical protein
MDPVTIMVESNRPRDRFSSDVFGGGSDVGTGDGGVAG